MIRSCLLLCLVLTLLVLPRPGRAEERAAATGSPATGSWPQWRGPNRDGISPEAGLASQWRAGGPPRLWQAAGLGKGYSSLAVSGGKAFTMGRRGKREQLIALDARDGSELWAADVGQGRHCNSTPTIDGEFVYALGLAGDLICAEVETGREVWRKNFAKDFGGSMMSGWGYSESPLIDGDRLICTPGGHAAMLVALDKRTGRTIWKAAMPKEVGSRGRNGAAYSSIVISRGAGVRQYVQLVGRGLIGVSTEDGRVLWTYNNIANGTANVPTPIVRGDHVFASTGYGTGAALLKLVPTAGGVSAQEVYFLSAKTMQNHHGGMILLGDHIYCGHGHGQGFPLCIEMLSGKVAWRPGRGAGGKSAAVAYADGHLYFRYEDGVMALIEATPEKYSLKGTFKVASGDGPSWPHPVIAGGRLFLRDQGLLFCYDLSGR